ncbi:hypothetical protein ACFQV2_39645 [Actinokineospora soli]|uniref:Uncharacterized protein n=1 Tax=Actinokineospora soli TaxID=1048753 RepID=A0ABW2TXM0_9PSEU
MLISPIAGPLVHARQALGAEPVLWAAFGRRVGYDVKGLDAEGNIKHGLAARAAGTLLDAMVNDGYAGNDGPTGAGADVIVFSRGRDGAAVRHITALRAGERERDLWVLTPHRLHIAALVRPDAPTEDKGLLKGLAGVFSGKERARVEVLPVRPVLDVPRAEIAGLSVATRSRRPCLRVELVDGSGFDLLFRGSARLGADTEPDQYERLLALSLGRTDPWV